MFFVKLHRVSIVSMERIGILVETATGMEPLPEKEVMLEVRSLGWELSRSTDHLGTFTITGIDSDWLESANENLLLRIVMPGYSDPIIECSYNTL